MTYQTTNDILHRIAQALERIAAAYDAPIKPIRVIPPSERKRDEASS